MIVYVLALAFALLVLIVRILFVLVCLSVCGLVDELVSD